MKTILIAVVALLGVVLCSGCGLSQQSDVQQEVVRRAAYLQDFDHVPTGTLIALHKEAVLMVRMPGQLVDACKQSYNPKMFLNVGVVARARVVAPGSLEYTQMLGKYNSQICK